MKIAVLFDGAGLARYGLEQAGHACVGVELDPAKHHLSRFVGSGQSVCADATTFDLSGFDAVWTSSPCQQLSSARTQGAPTSAYAGNFLDWCLGLMNLYPHLQALWVENVVSREGIPEGCTVYNAAQFLSVPVQHRNRIIGGMYREPFVYRDYRPWYPHKPNVSPCITASEYKGCATDKRRASRFFGGKLPLQEAARRQGLVIPDAWYEPMPGYSAAQWRNNLYEAIGNGVPVYMARAFGAAYTEAHIAQMSMFEVSA